ncbi:MAG: nitronate monooxygenase [Candidatus Obscuribacterales bacterium]|nr:nitronate monooxygenase [Candidatus Obscuribacterales bacterium]
MAGVSTPAMAAAVSNAGGLGSIGIGALDTTMAREMIGATRKLTDASINVNVFCHQPAIANPQKESAWLSYLAPHFARYNSQPPGQLKEIYKSFIEDDEMLDLLVELRPKVVSFHFGLPSQQKINRLKEAGIVLLATATNLSEAQQIERAGIDAVVAQGYEAGGHRGVFELSKSDEQLNLAELIPLLVSNLSIPVIAAGGIMDGADIVTALSLGAVAVQLGTAFVDCPESTADTYYRAALRSEAAHNTVMTKAISGRPARCLANLFTAIGEEVDPSAIPDYPIAYDAGKALNAAAKKSGEGGYGAQWAGQGAPRARSMPAAELLAQLQIEMEQAKK